MAEQAGKLIVETGRVILEQPQGPRGKEPQACWIVQAMDADTLRQSVRLLADRPTLEGRWRAGEATEQDRRDLGFREDAWTSACDCGSAQPCRHAQSALFRFRQEAKRDPTLWWAAAGVDAKALNAAIRAERAALLRAASAQSEDADGPERRAAAQAASGPPRGEPWLLGRMDDPPFWNRELPLAEWLKPLAEAASRRAHGKGGMPL